MSDVTNGNGDGEHTVWPLRSGDAPCRELLEAAGFVADRVHGIWLNNSAGRAISFVTVMKHDGEWLVAWLADVE